MSSDGSVETFLNGFDNPFTRELPADPQADSPADCAWIVGFYYGSYGPVSN